jgi:hypothetical protein
VDVLLVDDPEHIRWLNDHPDIVRPLDSAAGPLHRLINGRLLKDLRFEGELLPVFLPRQDPQRARQQAQLFDELNESSDRLGVERQTLGEFVATGHGADAVGPTVQHWCGRLFSPVYRATDATYRAAQLIANWPTTPPWRAWLVKVRGQLDQAKRIVSAAAEGDRHRIHGTTIGMDNVAATLRRMRQLAEGLGGPSGRTPDEALRQCLRVPAVLVRGCEREVAAPFLDRPLTRQSIVLFLLARAYRTSGDLELAFLGGSWSACPARVAVPEMLRSVWKAATEAQEARQGALGALLDSTAHLVPGLVKGVWDRVQRREAATDQRNGKGRVWH